jgi:hypothetical protein
VLEIMYIKRKKNYGICWKAERDEINLPEFRPEKIDLLTSEMPERYVLRPHRIRTRH